MQIRLLGSPAIIAGDRRLEHPSQKAMALLAYLAMRADEHISRSHLAALLWADSGEEQARANLRQTLSQLRKLFQSAGFDPIMVPFDKIVLRSEGLAIDARDLLDGLGGRGPKTLAGMPAFLEGFSVHAPEFEMWLSAQRMMIRARLVTHLEGFAREAREEGRHADAVESFSLALTIDPLQEALHRALMDVLALQGRSDEALQQYEACQRVLSKELQVEPDVRTRTLAAEIRARRLAKPRDSAPGLAFNKYPEAMPTLLFAGAWGEEPEPRAFADAQEALAEALRLQRNATTPSAMAVVADTGDARRDGQEARAILAGVQPGTIGVAEQVYAQFQHWSPFAFDRSQVLAGGQVVRRLLSEMSRHRLQVVPTLEAPRVKPAAEFSVGVLPLLDRSPSAGELSLGELLAEEITHRLSRYRSLTLAAPSAGQALRRYGTSVEQARHALGVNYLVDGSISHDGDRVQVRLTLTDLRDNHLVFSHRFDGAVSGLLNFQDELIDQITTAIFRKTEGAEVLRAERAITGEFGAYEWYLRGLSAHRRAGISPDNARDAFAHFTRAIEIDPRFARAIAWRLCSVSWYEPAYLVEPGMKEIQYALSIDEEDAEVQRIAGALHLYGGNHEDGIRHIERAVELNPSDAYLLASSAVYWAYAGQPRNGLKHIERAMMLDPFLPAWCVEDHGIVLYSMGEHAKAIASLRRLSHPRPRALAFLAASQAAAGRESDARSTVATIRHIARDFTIDQLLATTYYRSAEDARSLRIRLLQAGLR